MTTYRSILPALAVLVTLAFVTTGCPDSSKNKDGTAQTAEQSAEAKVEKVVAGLSVGARGIDAGIDTVRAFRRAGKIKPETSLALARQALAANEADAKVCQFILDRDAVSEADRGTILDDVAVILDLARQIESVTVSDNGNVQLVFDLGVTAGRSGLAIVASEFSASLPAGFRIRVTPAAREKLRSTIAVCAANRLRLEASIAELGALIHPADS
jgi:hypothetical protein